MSTDSYTLLRFKFLAKVIGRLGVEISTLLWFFLSLTLLCRNLWYNFDTEESERLALLGNSSEPEIQKSVTIKRHSGAHFARLATSGDQRIFFNVFLEKSLDSIKCCSVESAAKQNPNRPLHLFIATESNLAIEKDPCLELLRNYSNVEIFRLKPIEYFSHYQLEALHYSTFRENAYNFPLRHIFSFIEAYRHGGLYLDANIITLRPYSKIEHWNFFAMADPDGMSLTSSVFHVLRANPLVSEIIRKIISKFQSGEKMHSISELVSSAVSDCKNKVQEERLGCDAIKILPYHHFFPIPSSMSEAYYEKLTNNKLALLNRSYGIYVGTWKSGWQSDEIMKSKSVISSLAAKYCPNTYFHYSKS